jgi:hypothetical protein
MTNGFFSGSTIKEERMISFKRLPILLGAAMMMASAAFAQTTGTINIGGNTPDAFSLTDTGGAALSATVTLGTLTPSNNNTLTTGGPVTVRMRSNKAYKVTAQTTTWTLTNSALADGGDDITPGDIGFGVTAMSLTGANVVNTGSRSETLPAGFDVSGGWPAASNGLNPNYALTLGSLNSPTQILAGQRISKRGNLITDNNFISVSFGVAVLPQFFTPSTSFAATVTLTMASQ